jgi:hypothetical protein
LASTARLATVLTAWLLATPAARAAAPPSPPPGLFGPTRVWSMHLTVQAKDWERMAPKQGGFSRPSGKEPPLTADRKPRGGFGFDFEYVRAGLEFDGRALGEVGLRFKGNSTYLITSRHLKRPFKIDLDRHVKGQAFRGARKLTLNNNVVDPSTAREVLSYAIYRAAGVPAPRTAYAQLSLTVPGKYDRVFVGLYTLIETVDRTFLDDRFGSGKGMLLKPERVGPLDHLGDDWAAYEARYRPKSRAAKAAQRRLIELTRLVHEADEGRFRKEIGSYVDVDRFLRYAAVTVALSSLDSFVGFGHNYYLYLDPKSNRFVFMPWDLDHSFGGLTLLGSADELIGLSIRRPWAGRNRLVERLLDDEKYFVQYTAHLRALLATTFTPAAIREELAAIDKLLAPIREKEKKAVAARGESWNAWGLLGVFNRPADVQTFVEKRVASLEAQLAGKSRGVVLRRSFGQPTGQERLLVRPILQAADRDRDGKLSREEAQAGARALFRACDEGGKGELDHGRLTAGLQRLLPRPQGGWWGKPGPPLPAAALARAILARAGDGGKLTEEGLAAAAGKLFVKADQDGNGAVDSRELGEALRELLPLAPGAFGPPVGRPADPTKKEKR